MHTTKCKRWLLPLKLWLYALWQVDQAKEMYRLLIDGYFLILVNFTTTWWFFWSRFWKKVSSLRGIWGTCHHQMKRLFLSFLTVNNMTHLPSPVEVCQCSHLRQYVTCQACKKWREKKVRYLSISSYWLHTCKGHSPTTEFLLSYEIYIYSH